MLSANRQAIEWCAFQRMRLNSLCRLAGFLFNKETEPLPLAASGAKGC